MMNKSVLSLVVTHNGAETIDQLFHSFFIGGENTTRPILVIDNASEDQTVAMIQSLCLPNLEVVRMPKNVGVAEAYNLGIKRAVEEGMDWLLILDQDSRCGPFLLDRLLHAAHDLKKIGERVGAICPTAKSRSFSNVIHYPWRWTGYKFDIIKNSGNLDSFPLSIDSTITSGTLYWVEALEGINGFCERYFIDFVDHDCHMRLRRAGWSLWWEKRAVLCHNLGKIQKMTDEGLWIEHQPYRYYYMARNMTHGYWRFGGLKALCHFAGDIFRHIKRLRRYGESPKESIGYIFKGVGDAFLGKFGPLDSGG